MKNIGVKGIQVTYSVDIKINSDAKVPRLVIPSKLPTNESKKLLEVLYKTIVKFTHVPYEIWIVDNNSPLENTEWIKGLDNVNFVQIHDDFTDRGGSFENAIALETAVSLMNPDAELLMTFHQDTVVCSDTWYEYLSSKLNEKVVAAGVREDKTRVKEGILHVLGYLVRLDIMKENKLSFMPQLPNYDVGDKAIYDLRKLGYEYFAARNTIWDTNLAEKYLTNTVYNDLIVDRALNDDNQVFFMHLGRGTVKSKGEYNDPTKTTVDKWVDFIEQNLL